MLEIENDALFHEVTLLAAKCHVTFWVTSFHHTGSLEASNRSTNMADHAAERRQKPRGRYKEYLRHHNPYKFKAARRANRRQVKSQKPDSHSTISRGGDLRGDAEFDDSDVFDMEFDDSSFVYQCDVNSSEVIAIQTRTPSSDDLTQETLRARDLELEEMCDANLSEDELLNSSYAYELYIKEDNNTYMYSSADSVSDCDDHDDIELASEQGESKPFESEPDDILYSGAPLTSSASIVLLLTFVMKHKLTNEAFNDLLSVIEAHCPRPNNCKTSVKKLLEFVSQAKGDLEKHYFCDYCKAYFGKGTGNCNICGQTISKADGFFIEVPVEKQLQKFFIGKFSLFLSSRGCHVMTTLRHLCI